MSYFAKLDKNNVVINVLVADNQMSNEGYDWLVETFGGTWVKTSFNGSIRKNFAGIGFTYDKALDAFIPPKPFESWLLDEDTCQWVAPVDYPTDGLSYYWDEDSTSWVVADFSEPDVELE